MSEVALQAQINSLRGQVEELAESVRQIAASLRAPATWAEWVPRLTKLEEQVLWLLVSRDLLTPAMFEAVVAPDVDEPDRLLVTYVFKLRRKLEGKGITIENLHGRGYFISPPQRELLKGQSA